MNPAGLLLLLALVSVLVEHVYRACRKKVITRPFTLTDRLFIGVVVSNTLNFSGTVERWFATAAIPERVHVGVVEYVTSETHSLSNFLPVSIRQRVRVFTLSKKKFVHVTQSRSLLCKMRQDERYTLFMPQCDCVSGWDAKLISCVGAKAVLTLPMAHDFKACFPCASVLTPSRMKIDFAQFAMQGARAVPSVLCWAGALFGASSSLDLVMCTRCPANYSLHLSNLCVQHRLHIKCPAEVVLYDMLDENEMTAKIQRRISPAPGVATRYAELSGIDQGAWELAPCAKLGLTARARSLEKVAKYGSVSRVRLLLSELEA